MGSRGTFVLCTASSRCERIAGPGAAMCFRFLLKFSSCNVIRSWSRSQAVRFQPAPPSQFGSNFVPGTTVLRTVTATYVFRSAKGLGGAFAPPPPPPPPPKSATDGPLALFTSKDLMYVRTSLVVQSSSCGQVEYRMSYPPPLPFEGDIGGTVVLKQAVNIPLSIVAFSLLVSAVVS